MQIKRLIMQTKETDFKIIDNSTLFELFEYDFFRFENKSLELNHL